MSESEHEADHTILQHSIATQDAVYCVPGDGHCLTCSDEAIPVRVVQVNDDTGLALVAVGTVTEEIDVTLVERVRVDDILLAHGGVAIGRLEEDI